MIATGNHEKIILGTDPVNPQTAIHVNMFQTNAFKCKKCLPALENWQITGLDITLAAPRKYFRLPAP